MKIITLIKQVPDSTRVKVDQATGTLIRSGVPTILNPYDRYALEQALKIKKENGAELYVLTMGPAQAEEVIRLSLALGADKGILLSDIAFAGSDTWATSYALAKAVQKIGKYDIIMAGMMAIDGDTAQTGPGVSQQLRIPQITFCTEVSVNGKSLRAKKLIDGGHEILEAKFPVLITTAMPYGYDPAYPSFHKIADAENKPFEKWNATDIDANPAYLGLNGSPTRVDKIYSPPAREKGTVFRGSAVELADKVVEIIKTECAQ